ncbi:MAG: CDP-glucose 4,6-dehydratase [Candidatus Hodarchaeota archaeon]
MKKLFKNFFEDKTVLLTGHTGFIGSWLAICLIESGANVIGYALPPLTKKDNFELTNLQDRLINNIGDIRDYPKLLKIIKTNKPEILLHLAAQPIVRTSYFQPKETYDINVGGTVNAFEAFRKTESCRLLINFTTDKCYENRGIFRGYNENDRLGGYDPYSSSKACSELITDAYRRSFFNNNKEKMVSSIRCGNVIGGGDWQEYRLIPDIMRAMNENQEIIIRNPDYVRPWQFVLEPIRGILTLILKMWDLDYIYSGAWNLGPNKDLIFSVKDIVEKIITYMGRGVYKILSDNQNDTLHESKILMLDSTKAERFLGWKQILAIDETIKLLCDWYIEDNLNYDFNVNQINYYFKKVKEITEKK